MRNVQRPTGELTFQLRIKEFCKGTVPWIMNKGSKNDMSALPNANTRRGGNDPSCAGPTSCTSPEVQSDFAENSHTGVSSDFVHKEKQQWFVFRATYGRSEKAIELLKKANIETYMPKHYVIKEIDGKRKLIHEQLLPNLVFARMTRQKSHDFVKEPAPSAKWLKYYTDKTKPIENATGFHPPITIPDNDMLNFIRLTSVDSEHIMVLPPERCHFKNGDTVRVIDGPFTGVVGRVARAAGQQRVIIELEGMCNIATAYIPNDFMQKITI